MKSIKNINKDIRRLEILIKVVYIVFGFLIIFLAINIPIICKTNSYKTQAPGDYINESQIKVYDDRIIIMVANTTISRYADTGSMIPTLNENANGIKIKPKSEEDIRVGDIITFFRQDCVEELKKQVCTNPEHIIHRVVYIDKDDNGTYFVTKGDNNKFEDGKIRFKDVEYKTIGILY